MNNFYLANNVSINLNFLIFIENLYQNYSEYTEIPTKFPWLPIDKSVLLSQRDFEIRVKELWKVVIKTISSSNDLVIQDIEYWDSNRFQFNNLFDSNSTGTESYAMSKKSFVSWYWGFGHHMCCAFSDFLVEDYYKKLINMAEEKNAQLRNTRFYMQVVFDCPKKDWQLKNENMIVISPRMLLPKVEEIFESLL